MFDPRLFSVLSLMVQHAWLKMQCKRHIVTTVRQNTCFSDDEAIEPHCSSNESASSLFLRIYASIVYDPNYRHS